MAAGLLHRVRQRVRIKVPRALEYHVLKKMRQAAPEVAVLVHAPGGYPNLGADDRSARIGIENECEAIGQSFDGCG